MLTDIKDAPGFSRYLTELKPQSVINNPESPLAFYILFKKYKSDQMLSDQHRDIPIILSPAS